MGEENAKRKEGSKGKEKRIKNTTTYNGVTQTSQKNEINEKQSMSIQRSDGDDGREKKHIVKEI